MVDIIGYINLLKKITEYKTVNQGLGFLGNSVRDYRRAVLGLESYRATCNNREIIDKINSLLDSQPILLGRKRFCPRDLFILKSTIGWNKGILTKFGQIIAIRQIGSRSEFVEAFDEKTNEYLGNISKLDLEEVDFEATAEDSRYKLIQQQKNGAIIDNNEDIRKSANLIKERNKKIQAQQEEIELEITRKRRDKKAEREATKQSRRIYKERLIAEVFGQQNEIENLIEEIING